MTNAPATKITARNIEAGMTIQVAGIDSGYVLLGPARKSSPTYTVASITSLEQACYNSNAREITTTTGETFKITTRQKVTVVA